VVVYFKPCNEDDTLGTQSRQPLQKHAARKVAGAKSGLVHFRRGRKY